MPQSLLNSYIVSSAAVTPASFSGLWGWYDASTIGGLSDGDSLTGWSDLSGNSNDLTTSGAAPIYKTGIFGAQPAVRFNGVDQSLVLPSVTFGSTGWCVIAITKGLTKDSQVLGNNSTNYQVRINRSGANTNSIYWGLEYISGAFSTLITSARMNAYSRDYEAAHAYYVQFYDNLTKVSEPGTSGVMSFTCDRVGKTSFGGWFGGDMGELIIYDQDYRTAADLTSLYNGYLKPKWGLP